LCRRHPGVLPGREGEGWFEVLSRALESQHVNEVAKFSPRQAGGSTTTPACSCGSSVAMRRPLQNQIDDHGLLPTANESQAKVGSRLNGLDVGADLAGGLPQRTVPLVQVPRPGEEVEVLGAAMSEMKSGQGRTAGEEEPLLAHEKRQEELALQQAELRLHGLTRQRATGSAGTPRRHAGAPGAAIDPPTPPAPLPAS